MVTVNIAPTYLLFYVYLDSLDHLLHVYQVWSYYTNTKNCKSYEYSFCLNFWHRNHSDSDHSNQNINFCKLIRILYVMCDMCTKFEIIS